MFEDGSPKTNESGRERSLTLLSLLVVGRLGQRGDNDGGIRKKEKIIRIKEQEDALITAVLPRL